MKIGSICELERGRSALRAAGILWMVMFAAVFVSAGCGDKGKGEDDPCEGVDCSGHGVCVVEEGEGVCECDTGYTGPNCGECAHGYVWEGGVCVEERDPHYGTPTIDGVLNIGDGDWTEDQRVAVGTTDTDWGDNYMDALFVAYDDTHFYIGVSGWVEEENAIAVYIDVDYGPESGGLRNIASATDNDGALDSSLSADITLTDSSYGADMAVGTVGMASVFDGMDDNAGWRRIGENPADFPWIVGTVASGANAMEAAVSLEELFGGVPEAGARVALFARLVNHDGQHLANQTLPQDNPDNPKTVSEVAVITMGGGQPICNNNGICEPERGENFANCPGDCPATCNNNGICEPELGETHENCPDDCPLTGLCGDPHEFQWEDSVMYFVMTDRFFNGSGTSDPVPGVTEAAQFYGGDWVGLEMKLGYLEDLGINTIWLSAPFNNRDYAGAAIDPDSDPHMYSAYHGYWPSPADIDYSDPNNPSPRPLVENRLGTESELFNLIGSIHASNMYVLFDYVMNHVDSASGLYGAKPDWFVHDHGNIVLCSPHNWNDPYWSTRCAFTDYLPPFDFYNPTVREWSINDALWWAKEFNIDGYRLDAIKHVPMEWLTELRSAFNNAFPNPAGGRFYMVGETYDYEDQGLLAAYIDPSTKLDGQFDFPMRKRICDGIFNRSMTLDSMFAWMDSNDAFYPPGTLMSTWVGNHDIPRVIHFASGQYTDCYTGSSVENGWNPGWHVQPTEAEPYETLGLAFGLLMTNPGVPLVYYGDEIGLAGGGDPDNRRMMVFEGLNVHQENLKDLVSNLIRVRHENVALRRGFRQTVSGGSDTFVYKMTGCGEAEDVYVMVNRGDFAAQVSGLPAGEYTNLLWGGSVTGGGTVEVPARSILVLR